MSTFGRFLERAFDQIEMAIIGGARVKLVGTHVGVTLAADGPSQMALADVGFARALAHTTDAKGRSLVVLTPSDAVSGYKLVLAIAEYDGPAYLRAVRGDLPILYQDNEPFPLRGSKVVRQPVEAREVVVAAPVTVESPGVRRIPKTGSTAGDVLDYVGLSILEDRRGRETTGAACWRKDQLRALGVRLPMVKRGHPGLQRPTSHKFSDAR